MTVKILHTADIHLDSPLRSLALRDEALAERVGAASRKVLARLVDIAIDEGCAAMLIAGDLFDGQVRSARTAAHLLAELDRLGRAGVEVFCIRGNHDARNPISGEIDWPAHVHVFDGRGGANGRRKLAGAGIWIHGVSFRDAHAPDSLLPKFGAPEPGAVNIGMLHTSLAGDAGHDVYAPCTPAQLAAHGFDYWALGHIHRRQVHSSAPWIVMPGCPQGRDIGEDGPRSATLLHITDGAVAIEEIPTAILEFRRLDCDLTGAADDEDIRRRLRAAMTDAKTGIPCGQAILRLRLTGATPRAWALRRDPELLHETASRLGEEIGGLWIEKIALDLSDPAAAPAQATAQTTAAAEIETLMDTIRAEPGFLEQARQMVEDGLGALTPDQRRALAEDEAHLAALVDELAAEGAGLLAARLRQGAG